MNKLSPEDKALFQAAMKDVRPLKPNQKIALQQKPLSVLTKPDLSPTKPPPGKSHTQSQLAAKPAESPLYYSSTAPHIKSDERVFFARAHLQMKQTRALQRGKTLPQAKLDLHGHTIASAERVLRQFLLTAEKRQFISVQIISGKGGEKAILKNHLCQWLKQLPMVLAYASSPNVRGGTGAVDVLLRRRKDRS